MSMQSANSCGYDFAGSKDKLCDFKSVCDKLNAYGTEGVLYQGKDGKVIPNYAIQGAEDVIKGCLNQRNVQLNLSKKSSGELMNSTMGGSSFQKHMERVNQLNKKFLESVISNNEGDTKTAIELASINQVLSASDKAKESKGQDQSKAKTDEDDFKPPPTREDYSQMLATLENQAGKKLSDKSRGIYLDLMVEMADTSFYYQNDEKNDAVKDTLNEVVNQNPFMNGELFTNSKIVKGGKDQVLVNQKIFQQELDRSYKIFGEAKASIIKVLESRRTPGTSASVDAMIARINLIRMTNPSKDGLCDLPNAYYNPNSHTFTVCTAVMQLPDEAIRSIISHELGHSIDPCVISSELVEVTGIKKPLYAESKKSPKRDAYYKELNEKNGQYVLDLKLPKQDTEDRNLVVDFFPKVAERHRKGVYEAFETKKLSTAVPLDANPFKSVISCLGTPRSVNAQSASVKRLKAAVDEKMKQLIKSGSAKDSSDVKELLDAKAAIPDLIKQKGFCSGFLPTDKGGNSQYQEAFSDWLAGEVVATDLANKSSEKQRTSAFEGIGFFAGVGCTSINESVTYKLKDMVTKMGCDIKNDKDLDNLIAINKAVGHVADPHPYTADRIDAIFFANPKTREALGCGGNSKKRHCE